MIARLGHDCYILRTLKWFMPLSLESPLSRTLLLNATRHCHGQVMSLFHKSGDYGPISKSYEARLLHRGNQRLKEQLPSKVGGTGVSS